MNHQPNPYMNLIIDILAVVGALAVLASVLFVICACWIAASGNENGDLE